MPFYVTVTDDVSSRVCGSPVRGVNSLGHHNDLASTPQMAGEGQDGCVMTNLSRSYEPNFLQFIVCLFMCIDITTMLCALSDYNLFIYKQLTNRNF